jgi:hypothetical protein
MDDLALSCHTPCRPRNLQEVGAATGAEPFVWTKKVEKELGEGKKIKEISIFNDPHRQAERMVRW